MSPKRFKDIRLQLDLTQEEIAQILGVADKTVINRYEAGSRKPSNLMSAVMEILAESSSRKATELIDLLRKHMATVRKRSGE